MKIKATKTFVSGFFAATAGEKLDMPEKRARKLIAAGCAVEVKPKIPANRKAGGEGAKENR